MHQKHSVLVAVAAAAGAFIGYRVGLHILQKRELSCSAPQEQEKEAEVSSKAKPNRPYCALVLHEVTTDRWIHYLLRPALALGANKVIWLGLMAAKGKGYQSSKKGSTYSKTLKKEMVIPLVSLASLRQAKRHVQESCGSAEAPVVVGVVLDLPGTVCTTGMGHMEAGEAAPGAGGGSDNSGGCSKYGTLLELDNVLRKCNPGSILFYFAGPDGLLTEEQQQGCDYVLAIRREDMKNHSHSKGGDCLNISAMVSIVLFHFSILVGGGKDAVGAVSTGNEEGESGKGLGNLRNDAMKFRTVADIKTANGDTFADDSKRNKRASQKESIGDEEEDQLFE